MAKTHNLPQFPLVAFIWRLGNPTTNPPDGTTPAQLHDVVVSRQVSGLPGVNRQLMTRFIYMPKGTDVRPSWTAAEGDTVECPAGTGRYYTVLDVDDVAKGFANEFRVALVGVNGGSAGLVTIWPMPIP